MDSELQVGFMIDSRPGFFRKSYTVLTGFLDAMVSPELTQRAAGMREGFRGMKTSELWESVSSTLPGKPDFKMEETRRFVIQYLLASFPTWMKRTGTRVWFGYVYVD